MVNGWYTPQRAPQRAPDRIRVQPAVSTERGPVFVPHLEEQELSWTSLDQRAVDTARVLAADAVEKVGNGHPGTAMSLAPAAYLLFQKLMRHDPRNPDWIGRDRFILSPGHTSLTLYIQLFLSGYGLELKDLRRCARGAPLRRATPSTSTPPASRSPPARWARAWPPRSGSPTPSAGCAACSTPRLPRARPV